jgi:hypothetical protein
MRQSTKVTLALLLNALAAPAFASSHAADIPRGHEAQYTPRKPVSGFVVPGTTQVARYCTTTCQTIGNQQYCQTNCY